jgi:hypothetical protein
MAERIANAVCCPLPRAGPEGRGGSWVIKLGLEEVFALQELAGKKIAGLRMALPNYHSRMHAYSNRDNHHQTGKIQSRSCSLFPYFTSIFINQIDSRWQLLELR